jgi:hypothetical protein
MKKMMIISVLIKISGLTTVSSLVTIWFKKIISPSSLHQIIWLNSLWKALWEIFLNMRNKKNYNIRKIRNFLWNQKINHPIMTTYQNHLPCDTYNFLLVNKKIIFLDFLKISQSDLWYNKISHNFELPTERKLFHIIKISLVSELW